jgi:hypothetical protein
VIELSETDYSEMVSRKSESPTFFRSATMCSPRLDELQVEVEIKSPTTPHSEKASPKNVGVPPDMTVVGMFDTMEESDDKQSPRVPDENPFSYPSHELP